MLGAPLTIPFKHRLVKFGKFDTTTIESEKTICENILEENNISFGSSEITYTMCRMDICKPTDNDLKLQSMALHTIKMENNKFLSNQHIIINNLQPNTSKTR